MDEKIKIRNNKRSNSNNTDLPYKTIDLTTFWTNNAV